MRYDGASSHFICGSLLVVSRVCVVARSATGVAKSTLRHLRQDVHVSDPEDPEDHARGRGLSTHDDDAKIKGYHNGVVSNTQE